MEYDSVGEIMLYEEGGLDYDRTLQLFQYLVDTGLAWRLQGHYGRTAASLLERKLIRRPVDLGVK